MNSSETAQPFAQSTPTRGEGATGVVTGLVLTVIICLSLLFTATLFLIQHLRHKIRMKKLIADLERSRMGKLRIDGRNATVPITAARSANSVRRRGNSSADHWCTTTNSIDLNSFSPRFAPSTHTPAVQPPTPALVRHSHFATEYFSARPLSIGSALQPMGSMFGPVRTDIPFIPKEYHSTNRRTSTLNLASSDEAFSVLHHHNQPLPISKPLPLFSTMRRSTSPISIEPLYMHLSDSQSHISNATLNSSSPLFAITYPGIEDLKTSSAGMEIVARAPSVLLSDAIAAPTFSNPSVFQRLSRLWVNDEEWNGGGLYSANSKGMDLPMYESGLSVQADRDSSSSKFGFGFLLN